MIWIILLICSQLTFAQFNTYDLIIEYEQECYNDSSYELVYPVVDKYNYKLTYQEPYMAWVHKEPTWDGFREFVKRKYQELVKPK